MRYLSVWRELPIGTPLDKETVRGVWAQLEEIAEKQNVILLGELSASCQNGDLVDPPKPGVNVCLFEIEVEERDEL